MIRYNTFKDYEEKLDEYTYASEFLWDFLSNDKREFFYLLRNPSAFIDDMFDEDVCVLDMKDFAKAITLMAQDVKFFRQEDEDYQEYYLLSVYEKPEVAKKVLEINAITYWDYKMVMIELMKKFLGKNNGFNAESAGKDYLHEAFELADKLAIKYLENDAKLLNTENINKLNSEKKTMAEIYDMARFDIFLEEEVYK